jgi:endonuclease/exonuclease/phosphatase family metal-dependent hydrolase
MIGRRVAFFIFSIALISGLAFAVPAKHLPTWSSAGKKTLRVMTYNIHVGVGIDKKLDLQRTAEVIKAEHPDQVGLQEVDLSYPADKPVKRIDYVFTRRSDRIRAKQAWLVNTLASDHFAGGC